MIGQRHLERGFDGLGARIGEQDMVEPGGGNVDQPVGQLKRLGVPHLERRRRVEFRGISLPLPRANRKITDNGWYGSDHPAAATVEWGVEMLNTTADFLVDYMHAFEKIPLDVQ